MKRFVRCVLHLALAAALLCSLTIPAFALGIDGGKVGVYYFYQLVDLQGADMSNMELSTSGSVPPGLRVGYDDIQQQIMIYGTPTTAGSYSFFVWYDCNSAGGGPNFQIEIAPTTPPTTEDWMKAEQERGIPTTAATTPPTTAATTPPTIAATTPPTTAATTPPTAAPAVDTTTPAEMKITKHPTGEVVNPGGTALFVARADHSAWCAWRFIGPDGTEVVFDAVGNRFPGLRISGGNEGTLRLENIPVELNGWKAACLFSDGVSKRLTTSGALITVTAPTQATTAPTTVPTTAPTTIPTTAPTTIPTTAATTAPTAAAVIPAAVTEAAATVPTPTDTTEPVGKSGGSTVLLIAAIAIMAATLGCGGAAIVLALNKRKQTKSRYSIKRFRCDKCGWKPVKPGELPNFCPNCGDIFNRDDVEW